MSEIYPIAVPKWGIEMVEGTITTWNKSEGDAVAKGDEVFEMESDKIVNVWDSPVAGVLRRVLVCGRCPPGGALLGSLPMRASADATLTNLLPNTSAVAPDGARYPAAQPQRNNRHLKPGMPIPAPPLASVGLPTSLA